MDRLSDYEFDLPEERIAKYPAVPRDSSRLMVLGEGEPPVHTSFRRLSQHLRPGDLLVVNETRVVKARLFGKRAGGGEAEVFLLRPQGEGLWEAMVRPAKRLKAGSTITLSEGVSLHIAHEMEEGRRVVRFEGAGPEEVLSRFGHIPLPPYMKREEEPEDARRYQTVFAREGRSVAAPTAGLHFTQRVFSSLAERGVALCQIRLDVGPGTFKPVASEDISQHRMDAEPYFISPAAAGQINSAIKEGRRVVAVGTTVTRSLEDQMARHGKILAGAWETAIFLRPGHRFRAISGLLTNFHLPGSTLIMLVSALAGREKVLAAYREAIREEYRFYSYGDAMLVWGRGKEPPAVGRPPTAVKP